MFRLKRAMGHLYGEWCFAQSSEEVVDRRIKRQELEEAVLDMRMWEDCMPHRTTVGIPCTLLPLLQNAALPTRATDWVIAWIILQYPTGLF